MAVLLNQLMKTRWTLLLVYSWDSMYLDSLSHYRFCSHDHCFSAKFCKKVVFPLEILPAAMVGALAYDLLIGFGLCLLGL